MDELAERLKRLGIKIEDLEGLTYEEIVALATNNNKDPLEKKT